MNGIEQARPDQTQDTSSSPKYVRALRFGFSQQVEIPAMRIPLCVSRPSLH